MYSLSTLDKFLIGNTDTERILHMLLVIRTLDEKLIILTNVAILLADNAQIRFCYQNNREHKKQKSSPLKDCF
jgi:hypothetical protein